MSFRTTVILLVVFVLVGGYFYFFESRKVPQAEPILEKPRITSIETDDVVRFEARKGDKVVTVIKDEESKQWYLDGPERQVLDMARFNGVVLLFGGPQANRLVVEKAADLSTFGLDKPKLVVTLELKDGSKVQVFLGDRSPDEVYQYVQTSYSDAVYLLDGGVGDVVENFVASPPVATPTAAPTSPTATPTPTG